jgi:hypothetical protein
MISRRDRTLQIRATPEFRNRLKEGAERDFDGNTSILIRKAVNLYLDLRESQGPSFELVVAQLLAAAQASDEVAA